MLDLIIRGGFVVDGTGAPRRRADVGVRDGRVVAVGTVDEGARRTVDVDGRVITPGFIDVHTHLDAQAFWDPDLSPSPLHGVTTALAGNCGFTIAPLTEEAGAYLMPMLAKVEGMPLESLRQGVPWDWKSTAEYLDRLDGTLAINTGFMVGHSAMRRVVMGEAANERSATDEELGAMVELLRAGLAAGGIGFSTTTSATHNDADGAPVPSRWADQRELIELARVCRDFEGTSLELLPKGATDPSGFPDDVAELMILMSLAAQRPLNWNIISANAANLSAAMAKLAVGDAAAARGAKVVALNMPVDMKARFSFLAGFVLDSFDGWAHAMNAPREEKRRILADPLERRRLAEHAAATPNMGHMAAWKEHVIVETFTPEGKAFLGRRVGDFAAEQGKEPFDALVDLVLAEDLRTTFGRYSGEASDADWQARATVWEDPRALIGASDAGAHLDMIAAFRYATGFIEEAVRKRNLTTLERAVQLLTGAPARLYGLRDRGIVREGAHADLVVLDPDAVGSEPVRTQFDLPGGAGRLYAEALGIDHVFVSGQEIAAGGSYTGVRAGRVLRSGKDTATPTMKL